MQLGLGFLTVIMILIGVNPFLLETLTNMDVDINFFEIKHMVSGIQPFIWSIPIFILSKKYLLKRYDILTYHDMYRKVGNIFVATGYKLSNHHDGKLNKYLLWATTTLIILLILVMF